jgi:Holliday junction DNA helicase RuvA
VIAHLSGTLLHKKPGQVTLDVDGVGYKVFIPLSTYYDLDDVGAPVAFRIHTHVREDTIALYGFLTEVEEALFERLISVAGVGPALALKVLSGLEPLSLAGALRRGDLRRLSSVPGVGKKTAERLVVELKDKMSALMSLVGEDEPGAEVPSPERMLRDDLVSALVNLGYQRGQAEKSVGHVLREEPELSFEAALKTSLRRLSS